jgi:hypothetical protein
MSNCPFCEVDQDWDDDILSIYTKKIVKVIAFNKKIKVKGKLVLGRYKDPKTEFISQVRIINANYE